MSRMRASYGSEPARRADAMTGTSPEPMTMERLERKQFVVPEPVMMAEANTNPEEPNSWNPVLPYWTNKIKGLFADNNPTMATKQKDQIKALDLPPVPVDPDDTTGEAAAEVPFEVPGISSIQESVKKRQEALKDAMKGY